MANQLDLEEQEQLDQLKHFWKQYGNAITWVLIAVLGAYAAWNGYRYWQRSQAQQAAALFDEVERSLQSGDSARIDRVFGEMKERFPKSVYAQQSGLLVAAAQMGARKPDAARAALTWVRDHTQDTGYQAMARLRLAGIMMDARELDAALAELQGSFPAGFEALVADRQGDILMLQGNKPAAIAAYQKAYGAMDAQEPYRRLIEVKLNALGVDVQASAPTPAAAGG